jgi:ATP-dependent DNA helicase DinG
VSPASYTVRVPLDYDASAKACVSRIASALDAPTSALPRALAGGTRRFNVVLPPDLLARIDARRGAESVAAYASRLLAWTFVVSPSSAPAPPTASTPFSERPDQERYYEQIRARLAPGAIVLAEASTGIGKGRVLGYLAGTTPHALLATPTIKLVTQITNEYDTLRRGFDSTLPPPRVFIGRSHFISELEAREWIDRVRTSPDDADADRLSQADALASWLDAGAPIVQDDLRPLATALPGIAYLLDDAAFLAPAAADEIGLFPEDDPELDQGAAMYAKLRDAVAAKTEGPIITTHAALAWDDRLRAQQEARDAVDRTYEDFDLDERRVELFSNYETLLIDEAHLFAQTVAGIHSATVAFSTLRSALSTQGLWKRAKTKSGATLERAAERAKREVDAILPAMRALQRDPAARIRLPALLAPLSTALKPLLVAKRNRATAPVVEFAALLRGILNGRLDYDLKFSPHQHFPSLSAGPISLRKTWLRFWRPDLTVVLASATLYLPKVPSGTPDPTHTSVTLELPTDRLRTFPPVIAPWLTERVALYTSEACPSAFTPPKSFDDDARPTNAERAAYAQARQAWVERVAAIIAQAAETAVGGTLVLCGSYDDVDGFAAALDTRLAGRLVVQARRAFSRTERDFRARASAGQRPVWLATGTAWTGLDLSAGRNIPPERDRLLTDVVIPRLPYGTDHSRIFARRVERYFQAAHAAMAFHLRQGVGRLIRRGGVRDRRLWVLDGRIWTAGNDYAPALCRLLLAAYTDRHSIPYTKGSA